MTTKRNQAGATLVIGMIMLVLMTLLAVTSFTLGRGEYQIISNMQYRSEAESAANQTLEQVVSNLNFANNPANVFPSPCAGANTLCIDTTGDGVSDVTVSIGSRADPAKPTCIVARMIKNSTLDLSNNNDLGCAAGASQSFGVAGATTGDSLCAQSVWDVQAQAVDQVTNAKATVIEGLSVRVAADHIANSCP